MITSFADPEVEQGGTLKETIGWQASVPPHGTATHIFTFLILIGVGSTIDAVFSNVYDYLWAETLPIYSGSYSDPWNIYIAPNFPLGTYSIVTVIAESFNPDTMTITDIWDIKLDVNILTVVQGLGASIISTSFARG